MSNQSIKVIILITSVIIFTIIYHLSKNNSCKSKINYNNIHLNKGIDLEDLLSPTDSIELNKIRSDWQVFNYESDSFKIIKKSKYLIGRQLFVIEHYAAGRKHYGALIFPQNYDSTRFYPSLIWANGLNQSQPEVSVFGSQAISNFYRKLSDYFIIIPSFRGQSLRINRKKYCSDGFFGDAFDGATDDALRLTHLVHQHIKGLDAERKVIFGMSRGGTVALLAASRDTSIRAAISQAGPVDFFSKTVYNRYQKQYKYQFLSQTQDRTAIRAKMLKSSPIYFLNNYHRPLFILHGKYDPVVPISNAERVVDILKTNNQLKFEFTDEGHSFDRMNDIIDWLAIHNR